MSGRRRLAIAAAAVLALAVVLMRWYELGSYRPTGWEATWWARAALVLALAAIVAVRVGADRWAAALAATAAGCVAYRIAWPPDFGFGFDGLNVPVAVRAGAWIALGAGAVAAAAAAPWPGGRGTGA